MMGLVESGTSSEDIGSPMPVSDAIARAGARPGDRLPALDGVRGIAVLMVLLSHAMVIVRDTPISTLLRFGWIGVDLFFVLSGFLITGVLLRTRSRRNYYTRFYVRRALRIWPLYYVFLAVAVILMAVAQQLLPPSTSAAEGSGFKTQLLSILTPLPLYLVFLQNLWPASLFSFLDSAAVHATWSLCIEEHFYLSWPLFVRKFSRRSLIAGLSLLLLIFPVSRALAGVALLRHMDFSSFFQVVTRFTPFHLDSIAAGCLLGVSFGALEASPRKTGLALLLFIGGGAISSFAVQSTNPAVFALFYSGLAAMFSGFLALSLFGWAHAILTSRLLRYFGLISYGIYIIHPGVFIAFQSHTLLNRLHLGQHLALAEYCAAIIAAAISVGLASLSWRFFESRILALKASFAP